MNVKKKVKRRDDLNSNYHVEIDSYRFGHDKIFAVLEFSQYFRVKMVDWRVKCYNFLFSCYNFFFSCSNDDFVSNERCFSSARPNFVRNSVENNNNNNKNNHKITWIYRKSNVRATCPFGGFN